MKWHGPETALSGPRSSLSHRARPKVSRGSPSGLQVAEERAEALELSVGGFERLREPRELSEVRLPSRVPRDLPPYLQELYHATRTTVQLGVLSGAQILVVEKISGHRPLPMLSQVGGMIPAHCSALGRAVLAYSDAATVQAVIDAGLERRTPRTITTDTALRRELAAIPDRGLALDREEGNIGISCVAAPKPSSRPDAHSRTR